MALVETSNSPAQHENESEVLREVDWYLRKWLFLYREWNAIHYATGLIGIATTAVVALKPEFIPPHWQGLVAFTSTLSLMLITFLNPIVKASGRLAAWRHLSAARMRYRAGSARLEDLVDAAREAELMIH